MAVHSDVAAADGALTLPSKQAVQAGLGQGSTMWAATARLGKSSCAARAVRLMHRLASAMLLQGLQHPALMPGTATPLCTCCCVLECHLSMLCFEPPCRALQPGRHYLEFWVHGKNDIFDITPEINKEYEANATKFQAMAQEAQDFSSKFLSPRARFLYWRAAILAYRALLPDMDDFVVRMVKQLKEAGKLKEDGGDPSE